MKCSECGKEIKGEYASYRKNGSIDNGADYGADAENRKPDYENKLYFHRECFKQKIISQRQEVLN